MSHARLPFARKAPGLNGEIALLRSAKKPRDTRRRHVQKRRDHHHTSFSIPQRQMALRSRGLSP